MALYSYLIVGGGMTAAAAIAGIRETDPNGSIGLIGDELHPPYDRPPLSKGLWKRKSLDSIWCKIDSQNVTQHLGRRVQHLDATNKQVTDDEGTLYSFDKLLLATGGTPRRLPFGDGHIIYFRTLDDFKQLRSLTEQNQRFAVIGGGFIGWELAAALAMAGKQVVMVFPDNGIGSRIFPANLSKFLNDFYCSKGIEVLTNELVESCELRQGELVLKTHGNHKSGEREITTDAVVAGVGLQPNVELAQAARLTVENGILVDCGLSTSIPDIYAAGDVANFYNPTLSQRLRVEHEDNANKMGRLAGQAMAGQTVSYDYLPFFYSDLFELGFEAIGEIDTRLQIVEDWTDPFHEGVIYYLRDDRVRGVLLWNVWDQIDAARSLIAAPGPFDSDSLRGQIPA